MNISRLTGWRRAHRACIQQDGGLAQAIPAEDDGDILLYDQVCGELLTFITADPQNIDQTTSLLSVDHNLEHTAERVTNLCVQTILSITKS